MNSNKIKIGIDASRNRSGGAVAHVLGLINSFSEVDKFEEVHIWAYKNLLNLLPDKPWLVKHYTPKLEKSIIHQLWWQYHHLIREIKNTRCDILFSTDASTLCKFKPMMVLSQDLLSYEPGVMQNYNWGQSRLRLELIKIIQNSAFKDATGVIFLTDYSANMIQKSCGTLRNTAIIPHGIDSSFRSTHPRTIDLNCSPEKSWRCLYISNFDLYKFQWNVVKAIGLLRSRGLDISLKLIGGGAGPGRDLLEESISECRAEAWVTLSDFMNHNNLPKQLDESDIFIFASACENLPITLLEGMAKGMPIACSHRGPMPEVLGDGGEYFDPENIISISSAIFNLISNSNHANNLSRRAFERSQLYTWEECAKKTFEFAHQCVIDYNEQ